MVEKFKINLEELKKVESWRDFDEKYTLHIHPQYKTVPEYYYAASCLTKVRHITKPTLVIHSKDDPIVPIECLPKDECLANKNFIVGIVRNGGHVCYF
jgi:predicted alpha/beta-fold hydrolase